MFSVSLKDHHALTARYHPHKPAQLSHLSLRKVSQSPKAILDPFFLSYLTLSSLLFLCSGLNVICCVSISLSTWAVSRRTRSWLHLVSADSSPLCLWLFGSQSALAKHATETGKELLLRLATAQLATSTQRELKPTFCPGGKQRERLNLPNPPLLQHTHTHTH